MSLPLPIRILLWPLSQIYGAGARFRIFLYEKGVLKKRRLKAAVVSVGNLTVGGTGKTPMVLHLAQKFLADGKRVGILSRGYRGSTGTSDEVELMKNRLGEAVRFGVGPNRYKEGSKIEEESPIDIFLLDDGFQHVQLARDADILMVDGSKRLEKDWLLPAGTLREPFSACSRADILVLSRALEAPRPTNAYQDAVFYTQTKLMGIRNLGAREAPLDVAQFASHTFVGFCGVGNPQAFFRDLRRWNLEVSGTMIFRDHHHYGQEDVEQLVAAARGARATALITTEKDEQNLRGVEFKDLPVCVAVIETALSSESEFHALLDRLLHERRGAVA
jgi:tetraacyldisaccharide 4'-kinase